MSTYQNQEHLLHEPEQLIRDTFAAVLVNFLNKGVSEVCVQTSGAYVYM
jgi:hypothetical protein